MTTITTELVQKLRERYTPKPAPTCHICGSEMSIQRAGNGSLTYGCTGRVDTGNEGYKFADGRDFGDDHYAESRVTIAARGDDDVIALLDALAAKDKMIAELEFIRTSAGQVQAEYAEALGCPSDNESILEAIDGLKDQVRTIDMSNAVLQSQLEARPEQQPVAVAGFDAATAIRACMDEFPETVQDIVEECAQIAENTISSRHAPAAQPVTVKLPDAVRRNDADGWWMYKGRRVGGGAAEWYNQALTDVGAMLAAEGITIAEGE